jgi:hypothetical protein
MNPAEPIHLQRQDRLAIVFRVASALIGLPLIMLMFATSSWDNGWMIALFCLVTVGGGLAYYMLTSLAPCPKCGRVAGNFRIGIQQEKRKVFCCRRCGTAAYLTEGFYWQSDWSG